MPKKSILVVDDELSIRKVLSKVLKKEGYHVTTVKNYLEATSVFHKNEYNLIISDFILPDGNGIDLIKKLKGGASTVTGIIITGNATVESAIEATKSGIFHYVKKPFSIDEIIVLAAKALEHVELGVENKSLKKQLKKQYNFEHFIGDSEQMTKVFRLIERVADSDSTVLIFGESGTGKELVARALHYNSSKSDNVFVPINCSAIPHSLLESELFGYMKGAFTGANADRIGRFQAAHQGTLFLDEVGDMSPDLQVKLLRFLQTKEFEPVGSIKSIHSDARIIAATNIDLEQAVLNKKFREDLYYRLNVIPISMPSLRERRSDIPLLAHSFLKKFNEEKGFSVTIKNEETMNALMEYSWPGNVRELENLIQRVVIIKQEGDLKTSDLPTKLFDRSMKPKLDEHFFMKFKLPEQGINLKNIVMAFEEHLLLQALFRTKGNKNKASELLKMNRTTLVEKLKKRQISF